jgi:hypothetical protein
MHLPINVKSPNNIRKWQMGFNSAFKELNSLQHRLNKEEVCRSARPRPTALLSPSSDGKPEAATAVVLAPDDGHEDARNMLSCI